MKASIDSVAVLAGGLATRMRPLTETIPKSMLSVNGEPFIAHQLRLLRREGIDHVVLCLGHLGEQIQDFVGDGGQFGLSVHYSYDGETLLGTAGSLRKALPLLGDTFFVLYGDSYLDIAYDPIARSFLDSGKDGLMTVLKNQDHWDTSNVIFKDGKILCYDKKNKSPDMTYIDYGLGILTAKVLAAVPENVVMDLADIYGAMVRDSRMAGFEVVKRFYEIGSKTGLAETEDYLRHHSVK
jgi:NDP-sugar pyrophosphorylase family protein